MPNTDRIDSIATLIAKFGLANPQQIKGCTDVEIGNIEKKYGVILPDSYKKYLRIAGKEAGSFMEDCELYYPDILDLKDGANDLLAEVEAKWKLSNSHFVFLGREGIQYLYFDCAAGNDPPVFRISDESASAEKVAESFSSWLEGCIKDEAEIHE